MKSLFGREIIKTKAINKSINNKQVKKYNYSFNEDLFKNHLDLFKISLNNKNKYKYVYIINDIKKKYYNDVEITNEDKDEYNKYLSNKHIEINEEHKSNIKEHLKTEENFKKINKKLVKEKALALAKGTEKEKQEKKLAKAKQ